MNVFFHTLTAVAIATLAIDASKPVLRANLVRQSASVFLLGIMVHGILDYIPHRYPIHSKVDVIASLLLIIILTLMADKKYRVIVLASFVGCVFPDIVDLSAGVFNKYLSFHLPVVHKIFPWHWPQYSGSIYDEGYGISLLNHGMVVGICLAVLVGRFRNFKTIFRIGKSI